MEGRRWWQCEKSARVLTGLHGWLARRRDSISWLSDWCCGGVGGVSLDVTVIRSAAAHVFPHRTQKTRTHRRRTTSPLTGGRVLRRPCLVYNSVWYSLSWSRRYRQTCVCVCLRGVVHTGTHHACTPPASRSFLVERRPPPSGILANGPHI